VRPHPSNCGTALSVLFSGQHAATPQGQVSSPLADGAAFVLFLLEKETEVFGDLREGGALERVVRPAPPSEVLHEARQMLVLQRVAMPQIWHHAICCASSSRALESSRVALVGGNITHGAMQT
jgi:hypothetical protein